MASRQYLELRDKINIRHAYSEQPDPALWEKHFHNVYEILHVTRGRGYYTVEGTQYEMQPESLIIFRPGEFHYVSPNTNEPYERYVIHFARDAFGSDSDAILDSYEKMPFGFGIYYAAGEMTSDIKDIFRRLSGLTAADYEKTHLLSRLLVEELLLSLSLLPPASLGKNDAVGARAIRYIGEHITEPLSLEKLAKELLISKFHLCRTFKEYNGITISSYLIQKRILLAREKLVHGMKPREAAYAVGFDDYSAFFRAYRKITGHSPKEDIHRIHDVSDS